MDFIEHVRITWKPFASSCTCSSVEGNKAMIRLAFRLSVQFGVRTRGNVLKFVWSLNNTTYSNQALV